MPASAEKSQNYTEKRSSSNAGSLKRLRSISPKPPSEASSRETDTSSDISYQQSTFESRRNDNKPLRIAIEGNIAAGKSTFIKILQDLADEQPDYHWYVQPEPLAKWTNKKDLEKTEVKDVNGKSSEPTENTKETKDESQTKKEETETKDDSQANKKESNDDESGGNLLDAFYKNPKRWAYTMEAYTFVTRMKQAKDAERQVQSDMQQRMDSVPHAITFLNAQFILQG